MVRSFRHPRASCQEFTRGNPGLRYLLIAEELVGRSAKIVTLEVRVCPDDSPTGCSRFQTRFLSIVRHIETDQTRYVADSEITWRVEGIRIRKQPAP